MAGSSPAHHMDRLGYRMGDRSGHPFLAAEERIGKALVLRGGHVSEPPLVDPNRRFAARLWRNAA